MWLGGKLGNLDARIECIFSKEKLKIGIWSMLMPYLNPVYRWICLKIFLRIDIENIYWHGRCKISYFSNKPLHEVLGFAAPIIITILFPPTHHCQPKPLKRTISYFIWAWEGRGNSSNNKTTICKVTWTQIHESTLGTLWRLS